MPAKDLTLMILSSRLWPINSMFDLYSPVCCPWLISDKCIEGVQQFFNQDISRLGMAQVCRKTLTLNCRWAENTFPQVVMMSNYITSLSACHSVVGQRKVSVPKPRLDCCLKVIWIQI